MKDQGILQLVLITTVILIGFNSCTVKKRLYQPGYHVEWHNSNKKHKTQQKSDKHIHHDKGENQVAAYENSDNASYKTKPIKIPQESESSYASNDENMDNLEIIRSSKEKPSFFTESTQATPDTNKYVVDKDNPDSEKSSKTKKDTHWTATGGYILSLFSLILTSILGITGVIPLSLLGLLTTALPFGLFAALIAIALLFLLGILGIILSLIGMKRIKANSEDYKVAKKGFKLGIISIIISVILVTLSLCILFFVI